MTTAASALSVHRPRDSHLQQEVSLVDLLDRLLGAGVMLAGDITISLAGVDLVRIQVHALVASVGTLMEER